MPDRDCPPHAEGEVRAQKKTPIALWIDAFVAVHLKMPDDAVVAGRSF
jgi:hypothetical protein